MHTARLTHLNVPSFPELCHDRAIPVLPAVQHDRDSQLSTVWPQPFQTEWGQGSTLSEGEILAKRLGKAVPERRKTVSVPPMGANRGWA